MRRRRLNEAKNQYDSVWDTGRDLIEYLQDCPLNPNEIGHRLNVIENAIKDNMSSKDYNRVYKIALSLDGDRDLADLARKHARDVFDVCDNATSALMMMWEM